MFLWFSSRFHATRSISLRLFSIYILFFFPRVYNCIESIRSRNSRAARSHGFTRSHEIVNWSREINPLTDFGNHFIAHSLLSRSKLNATKRYSIHVTVRHLTSYILPRQNYLRILLQSREILYDLRNNEIWETMEFVQSAQDLFVNDGSIFILFVWSV